MENGHHGGEDLRDFDRRRGCAQTAAPAPTGEQKTIELLSISQRKGADRIGRQRMRRPAIPAKSQSSFADMTALFAGCCDVRGGQAIKSRRSQTTAASSGAVTAFKFRATRKGIRRTH